jgi:hypothetical protein
MADIEDFKNYLAIDQNNLDEELIQHATIYFKVAEEAVIAASNRDSKKEDLAETDAWVDGTIRKLGEKQKLTEGAIKNQVILNGDHQEAQVAYLAAR